MKKKKKKKKKKREREREFYLGFQFSIFILEIGNYSKEEEEKFGRGTWSIVTSSKWVVISISLFF
uniref:Uncharacterized protein n=1 Tax=Cannabis sativa TaxID=3483 RepID=A0A803R7A0_CANSA